MKNGFDFFDKTFQKEIYQDMVDKETNKSLVQTLIQMQTEQGISRKEAAAMAGMCIAAVTSCESVRSAVADAPDPLVDDLLAEVEKSSDAEMILHKMYFGLIIHPNLVAENKKMTSEEPFWRYYNENKDTKTVEELRKDVRNALTNYQLTPEVMKALAKKMESSGDYLVSSMALGEGGISFKCIAAMELYLNNRNTLTIHEAANVACAEAEVQAAADAVGQGMITRDMAKKILIIAGITVAVVGLGIMIYHAGSVSVLAKAAASATDIAVALPEVFEEFAFFTSEMGDPLVIVTSAETIRENFYYPLMEVAKHKEEIGGIVVALGAGTVALSQKTADLIGKFRVGFTKGINRICESVQLMADQPQTLDVVAEETACQTVQEEIQEQQVQPATLGAK